MIIELQEDGDDLILPFPDDILDKIGWKKGDSLEWVDNQDGSFTLRKV